LRWKAVSTVGRVPQKPLVDQFLEYLHAFLAADLKQACRLIDRRRKPAHLHEFAANAIADLAAQTFARFRSEREGFELNVRKRGRERGRLRSAHGHKISLALNPRSTIRPNLHGVKVGESTIVRDALVDS
jgi:hypothetical protein